MADTAFDTSLRPPAACAASANGLDAHAGKSRGKDEAEFTFDDLIDIINPLQHLPIVSTIYRALTGDQISVHARAIGGGLYGGPIGLLVAGAAMAVEEATGLSPAGELAKLFSDDDGPSDEVAALTPPEAADRAAAQPAPELAALAMAATTPLPLAPTAAKAALANSEDTNTTAQATPATIPYTPRTDMRFFALNQGANRTFSLAGARQAAPPNPAPLAETPPAAQAVADAPALRAHGAATLSAAQSDLLERFIAGAKNSGANVMPANGLSESAAAPKGATADWFVSRMQANLQKYANAQNESDQRRSIPAQ